jgi:hypothetical protein
MSHRFHPEEIVSSSRESMELLYKGTAYLFVVPLQRLDRK